MATFGDVGEKAGNAHGKGGKLPHCEGQKRKGKKIFNTVK